MPSRRLLALAVSTGAAVLAAPAAEARACAGAGTRPVVATLGAVQSATLCLVNRERTRRGLAPLRADRRLARAARAHSADMVRRRYFAHDSRSGRSVADRVRATGFLRSGAGRIGENIAWGSGSSALARSIVASWMRSAGHRANILDRGFRRAGAGAALGAPTGGGGATYTLVLAG